ncbi:UPF0104 family protein [Almyronema epifaneia]|uniref:UPF0104 family protein n=1 Tax=Almyronema epifaneia S1 TaxID=2991925 RepID=A0ABW6ICC7_9CYAN
MLVFKSLLARFKPYVRWVVLGGTLLFIGKTLLEHWSEVIAIRLSGADWACLATALGLTLAAHIWSGWVWSWIVQTCGCRVGGIWATQTYLKTNIAKYLPGNVWHFYGRVRAVQSVGASLGTAVISVLLEPLLMAAAALMWALFGSRQILLQLGLLGLVLVGIHPRLLNPLLRWLGRAQTEAPEPLQAQLSHYPWQALLGELGFVALRGLGFVGVVLALQPLTWSQLLELMSGFSWAWLLGLMIPGAPGGVGVFEATAIALLSDTLSAAVILSSVVLYRVVSILAEVMGAGLTWLDELGSAKPPHPTS